MILNRHNVDAKKVFLCHASEDKEDVARPLAESLKALGLEVWYDDYELQIGDSLREKIDAGLNSCDYGVVILSRSFIRKRWPQNELSALLSREFSAKRKFLFPVWHGVTSEDVSRWWPLLADRIARNTFKGVNHIAKAIFNAIQSERNRLYAEVPSSSQETTAVSFGLIGRSYPTTYYSESKTLVKSKACAHANRIGTDAGFIYCVDCGDIVGYGPGWVYLDPDFDDNEDAPI